MTEFVKVQDWLRGWLKGDTPGYEPDPIVIDFVEKWFYDDYSLEQIKEDVKNYQEAPFTFVKSELEALLMALEGDMHP